MNIKKASNDIKKLDSALSIIEKTESYLHFNKSHLILEICEEINVLREKIDIQVACRITNSKSPL